LSAERQEDQELKEKKEDKESSQPAAAEQQEKEPPSSSLEEELAAERARSAELYDQLLRLRAEMDNFRKRLLREKEELVKYATEELVKNILPVMDDFERAIVLAKAEPDFDNFLEGITLIYRKLQDVLTKAGLNQVPAVGQAFDPTYHEAVHLVESEEHPENVVVEELRRGYIFGDRVLRPSLVAVSKGKPKDNTDGRKENHDNGS